MKILAVEFSSDQRSVAVVVDGRILATAKEVATRATHAFALIKAGYWARQNWNVSKSSVARLDLG